MIASEIYDLIAEIEKLSPEQISALDPDILEAYQEAIQTVASAGVNSRRMIESPDTFEGDKSYDVSGRLAVNTLSNSQYDAIDYLSEKNPNMMFSVLNGEIVSKPKGDTEAKWRPLDPSTLELIDIPEAADEIGSGIASQLAGLGTAAAAAPTTPVGMAFAYGGGAAGGAAGFEGLRQALGRAVGVNKGISPGQIATEGAIAGPLTAFSYGIKPTQFLKDGKLVAGARDQLQELLGRGLNADALKTLKTDIKFMSDSEVARQLSQNLSSLGSKAGEGIFNLTKQTFGGLTGRDPGVLDYMKNVPFMQNLPQGTRYSEGFLGLGGDVPPSSNQALVDQMIKRITNISSRAAERTLKEGSDLESKVGGKPIPTRKAVDILVKYRDELKKKMDANNGYNAPYYAPMYNKLQSYVDSLMVPDPKGGFKFQNDYSIIKSLTSTINDLGNQIKEGAVPDMGLDQARTVYRALKQMEKPLKESLQSTISQEKDIARKQAQALAANSRLGQQFMTGTGGVTQYDTAAGQRFASGNRDEVGLVLSDLKKSLDTQNIPEEQKNKIYNKALTSIRRSQVASLINNTAEVGTNPSKDPLLTFARTVARRFGGTAGGQFPAAIKRGQEILSGTAANSRIAASKLNQPLKTGGLLTTLNDAYLGTPYDPYDLEGEQEKWNKLALELGK